MTGKTRIVAALCMTFAVPALFLYAQDKKDSKEGQKNAQEHERKVKESEVPAAAVAAIKKLAGGAEIMQYEEETENGETFYEGSWKTPRGKMEVLVTPQGDVVVTEEGMSIDRIPAAAASAAKKWAPAGTELRWEKVMEVRYEAKYKKDGTKHEIVLTPTGKTIKTEEKPG